MEKLFDEYLHKKGYSANTCDSYVYWVKRVMEKEDIACLEVMASIISALCVKYDTGGQEEDFGNQGKRSVINALKRFKEFCRQLPDTWKEVINKLRIR